MLQGKQLILATREFASENRRLSWWYTLSTFIILCLSLMLCIAQVPMIIRVAASIFSGLVMIRMFVIYHDYVHETILQHSKIAKLLFTVIGIYILAPITIWKSSHSYHHRHNSKLYGSNIGSFPIYSKEKYEKASLKIKMKYLFIRHPLTILFGYVFTFLWGMCLNPVLNDPIKFYDSILSLILHICIQGLLLLFGGWQALVLFSIIPHFVGGALGAFLFYVQHNFPGTTFEGNSEWTYEGAALDSSSYLDLNPFLKWVTANIGYHHIHHLNSRIPFYRLPEVMKHFPELQHPKTTSLRLHDVMACLRLKVWDHESRQMITLTHLNTK
jgi:omega-6 fatty acid desaturase (delta-12 desaturase)